MIFPEALGKEISCVLFLTKAFPFSITLRAPVPVKLNKTSEVQPEKASESIFAAAGKFTFVKDVQRKNTLEPILVANGKSTFAKDVQFWKEPV